MFLSQRAAGYPEQSKASGSLAFSDMHSAMCDLSIVLFILHWATMGSWSSCAEACVARSGSGCTQNLEPNRVRWTHHPELSLTASLQLVYRRRSNRMMVAVVGAAAADDRLKAASLSLCAARVNSRRKFATNQIKQGESKPCTVMLNNKFTPGGGSQLVAHP